MSYWLECVHHTMSTRLVCIMSVHSDFGGHPDCSATWLNIGFVLQMHTLASSPPVVIREPSGCTWQENIDTRFSSPRIAESARAHDREREGEGCWWCPSLAGENEEAHLCA